MELSWLFLAFRNLIRLHCGTIFDDIVGTAKTERQMNSVDLKVDRMWSWSARITEVNGEMATAIKKRDNAGTKVALARLEVLISNIKREI